MNQLYDVIIQKSNRDIFGAHCKVNQELTVICPWCHEKKGYKYFTRHLYSKCPARSTNIPHLSDIGHGTRTRSSRNPTKRVEYTGLCNGDETEDNTVDIDLVNDDDETEDDISYASTPRSGNENNGNKGRRGTNRGGSSTHSGSTGGNKRKTRRHRQMSDDSDYAPSSHSHSSSRRSKRRK